MTLSEPDQSQALSLERALPILRRRAWIIALCFVLATGAAFGFSKAQTKKYTATASVLFKNPGIAQQAANVPIVGQADPQGQRDTNLRLLQRPLVAQQAAVDLGAGLTAKQVENAVSVSGQGQSNLVSVSATATDPAQAARIANGFADAFVQLQRKSDQATVQSGIALVRQQYLRLPPDQRSGGEGQALKDRLESLRVFKAMQNNTQVAQRASVPTSPSSPKVARNTILGGVLGLLLGLCAAFVLDRLDRRLRQPADIEDSFGLPMLGLIPHGRLAVGNGRTRAVADLEPFRMLRAHLRYFNVDREVRTVLVTSAAQGEGKTTIACNLALAAASMGTNVLLIEADLRRPMLAQRLGLLPVPGLADALVGSAAEIETAIQHVDVEGRTNGHSAGRHMDVLVAGAVPPNPAELVESHSMQTLLDWAAAHYSLVVIDTPPISVVSDAIPLMEHVDGVIAVSRLGQSTRDATGRLRRRLEHLRAPMLGVVANDARGRQPDYGYGYGAYGEDRQARFDTGERRRPVKEYSSAADE